MIDQPVIFLDKDGTLIKDIPYNVDPDLMVFEPGAVNGLRRLYEAGFRFIVVSNQSGVARGYFPEEALIHVKHRLREMFQREAGVPLDGFYYCPHHPDGIVSQYAVACDCRKPEPGMLFRAAQEHRFSLGTAWMVGDILNDVEAGKQAGCQTVLLDVGHETEWEHTPNRTPDLIATNLEDAAEWILNAQFGRHSSSLAWQDLLLARRTH